MDNKKSRSLRLASRLVGYLGVFASLIGALSYVIMHEMGYQLVGVGPFRWQHLYVVAAFAGLVILVAVILRIISNAVKTRSAENEEVNCEVCDEEECDECDETECEDDACNEGDCEEIEIAEDGEAAESCTVCDLIKGRITPETKEKIVATVKKNAPVIVAVAATAIVTAAISKAAAKKKQEKIRQSLLRLFY